jgi:transcriptional regulator with XRE-family HTH domain
MVKAKLSASGHFNRPEVPFGNHLRKLRQDRGFTQEELAHRAHLHRNYVGGVERGERNISLINIVELAKALSVRPDELLRKLS